MITRYSQTSWKANQVGFAAATATAKSLQLCLTLCDPIDGSPPGSPVPGEARTLEWVAISFSNAWKWKVKGKSLSHVRLLATPWTAAHQAPPSMGFSRQEYWSGLPFPSPFNMLINIIKNIIHILMECYVKSFLISSDKLYLLMIIFLMHHSIQFSVISFKLFAAIFLGKIRL